MSYEIDINNCVEILNNGGVILYPTDTVWGLGCDATNEQAVANIFKIKNRIDIKSLIILLPEMSRIKHYATEPNVEVIAMIKKATKPTTIIYPNATNLALNSIASDDSIAIRIPDDTFCKELLLKFGKPLVSTSANISGSSTPLNFDEINDSIKEQVNYICNYKRQEKNIQLQPSRIIKWNNDNSFTVIRD